MTKEIKEAPKLLAAPKPYDFGFTLGADPEFTTISGTRPIAAREILSTFFKDVQVKTFGSHGGGYDVKGGNIGWDGHAATGELRPLPGTPREVAQNMKDMFAETQRRIPFIDLSTLTVAGSTGGHIHLAIPENLTMEAINQTAKWRAIERAMASFMLLVIISENDFSRELRRRTGNYGEILDFRYDQKFSYPSGAPGYTMEVRSPSAEWITTEKLAIGTLAYTAIAFDSIIKNKIGPLAGFIFENDTQAHNSIAPLIANFANLQRSYLNKIRPFIRKHEAYKDYKAELELVLNPENVKKAKQDTHYSVSEGWGLTKSARHIATKKFLAEESIEEATDKFPESVIRNLSQFAWNDDVNVESFATALSKRCIALGWKPHHEYFLFGMKKGIDEIVIRNEAGEFVAGHDVFKTIDDYRAFQDKFAKLENRVRPMYGQFIHPRTGEIVKDGELKRVMVGIPYSQRKKGDIRPLIRTILRFEKNTKAFTPLDTKKLSNEAGTLRKTLEHGEDVEKGVKAAIENGDQPRNVSSQQARDAEDTAATRSFHESF